MKTVVVMVEVDRVDVMDEEKAATTKVPRKNWPISNEPTQISKRI
jgi:hypothetical protein